MAKNSTATIDLASILVRFPEDTEQISRLVKADAAFRDICEDYTLARAVLETFERHSINWLRVEFDDYKTLIAELEKEIGNILLRNAAIGLDAKVSNG